MTKTRRDNTALAARSHSSHQNKAHEVLTEAGFVFQRRSGKSANVYRHPDGRRISVTNTPRNEGFALDYLRQALNSPRLGLRAGESPHQKEAPVPTTTVDDPTAPLRAMAEDALKRQPDSPPRSSRRQERNQAFARWVGRVIKAHGPLPTTLLEQAAGEMGFERFHVKRARLQNGCVAYLVPGEGIGRGKGQMTTYVALPDQVPAGASVLGAKSAKAKASVEAGGTLMGQEAREATQAAVGANNGQPPEPRVPVWTAPVEGFSEDEQIAMNEAELEREREQRIEERVVAHAEAKLPLKPLTPETIERLPDFPQPDPTAIPFQETPDVAAAAQMLLESLGLKTAHPRMAEGIQDLDEFLQDLEWRLGHAREKLATLKGLLS